MFYFLYLRRPARLNNPKIIPTTGSMLAADPVFGRDCFGLPGSSGFGGSGVWVVTFAIISCPLTILTKVFSTSPYSYLSTSRGDSFIRAKDSKSKSKRKKRS